MKVNTKHPLGYKPKTFVSRLIFSGLLLGILAGLPGCALVHHYDAITGKVVDLDTGEPLEGAAVHASYYTTFYNMIDPTSWYLNSQEALTDDKGEFIIPSQFTFAFRPMNLFSNEILFVIYKPGYGCLGICLSAQCGTTIKGDLKEGSINLVGLPKLKTREERRLNASCTPADGDYPMLLQLLNQERIEIGIPPLPAP